MSWREEAACRGKDPAMFFPRRGDVAAMNAAKAICAACPVRQECAEASLFEREGVWGGMSKRERRRVRSQRRAA